MSMKAGALQPRLERYRVLKRPFQATHEDIADWLWPSFVDLQSPVIYQFIVAPITV